MRGELQEQRVQRLPLLRRERGEELPLEALRDDTEIGERLPAGAREANDMAAAVVRVPLALDEALLLELVEQADELAAVAAESVGDRRLRLACTLVEERARRLGRPDGDRGRSTTGSGPRSTRSPGCCSSACSSPATRSGSEHGAAEELELLPEAA